MSFVWGLRIFTVVAMGWVVAHSARTIVMSIGGQDRLTARALLGQALTGVGAFIIGWGLLPGGSASAETTMMIVGCLTWAIGATVEPVQRATPNT